MGIFDRFKKPETGIQNSDEQSIPFLLGVVISTAEQTSRCLHNVEECQS